MSPLSQVIDCDGGNGHDDGDDDQDAKPPFLQFFPYLDAQQGAPSELRCAISMVVMVVAVMMVVFGGCARRRNAGSGGCA